MQNQLEMKDLGEELAALINTLPQKERRRYQRAISMLIHDLRQSIGVIFSAQTLLKRNIKATPDDLELLNAIDNASKRAMYLLTDFAQPFDSEITLPVGRSSSKPEQ
jgi:signal transduction histidine kinase